MRTRLKLKPIISMACVSAVVALLVILIDAAVRSDPNALSLIEANPWLFAHLVHIPQFLIPFLIILYLTKGRPQEYGFNLRQDSHITHKRVLATGLLFGLLFSFKYMPQIFRTGGVEVAQPVNAANIVGRMTFQWIVVGLSEETMFRGLIQTYLMKNLEGEVRILGHDFHIGTVIGAVLWGLFHFLNVLIMPIGPVVFLVVLTTAIGLILGYAYQRTGSLLTTIIMHNTIFGVPLTIGYLLNWLL
ncbi:MAG: type II CAAX endopeptidase family protein [bacterium]|jgi:membrane protease YdiL (CAAX protease family)